MAFAIKMASLFFDMINDCKGCPELPAAGVPSALEKVCRNLHSVYEYLRLGKELALPSEWRLLLPRTLDVGNHGLLNLWRSRILGAVVKLGPTRQHV